jgi:hypothetical protein
MSDEDRDDAIPIGSSFYHPEGSVNVVPTDLSQFAEFVDGDRDAYVEVKRGAVDEFLGNDLPAFWGDLDAAGGMPEGMGFAREYFAREMAMMMFLNDVDFGLMALSSAARFIHTDYLMADFLSGGDGSAGFAGYRSENVVNTFSGGPDSLANQLADGEHGDEAQSEFNAAVAEQEELGREGLDGDQMEQMEQRGGAGETLHEGQPGEYTIDPNTDVPAVDGAVHLTSNEDGDVYVPWTGARRDPA